MSSKWRINSSRRSADYGCLTKGRGGMRKFPQVRRLITEMRNHLSSDGNMNNIPIIGARSLLKRSCLSSQPKNRGSYRRGCEVPSVCTWSNWTAGDVGLVTSGSSPYHCLWLSNHWEDSNKGIMVTGGVKLFSKFVTMMPIQLGYDTKSLDTMPRGESSHVIKQRATCTDRGLLWVSGKALKIVWQCDLKVSWRVFYCNVIFHRISQRLWI